MNRIGNFSYLIDLFFPDSINPPELGFFLKRRVFARLQAGIIPSSFNQNFNRI